MTNQRRFDVSDLILTVDTTKQQNRDIYDLTQVGDFIPVNYDKATRKITFQYFDEYETVQRFFKKLVKIVPNIFDTVTVTDTEKDTYWILKIEGSELKEFYGVAFWGDNKDKAKIKSVLEAHLDTTPDKLNEIVDQLVLGIKGYFDELEEEKGPLDDVKDTD
jgi:hypothetical protein